MKLVGGHIIGLLGISIVLFDLIYNLLKEPFDLTNIDKFILLIGVSLFIVEIIPEKIKLSLSNYSFIHTADKLVSDYGIKFLFFCIIIGFYLRFNNIGNLSFWIDELITTYAAIGILHNGTSVLPSGILYTRSILNTALIALSFKIFGISEFSARIVSAIFATLTIPLIYQFGVKVANKRVGILAALILTFSVWEIVWAREARMYAQFQFLYLLTVYLFISGLEKKKINILFLAGIAFIGASLSHILTLSFIPVAVIYIIIYKREILKRYFVHWTLAVLGITSLYISLKGKTLLDYFLLKVPLWGQKPFYYYVFTRDLGILLFLVSISIMIFIILWKLKVLNNESNNSYLFLNFFVPFFILTLYVWKIPRYAFFIFPFLVLLTSKAIDLYIIRNVINEDVCKRISDTFKMKIELVKNVRFTILSIIVILLLVQMVLSIEGFQISQKDHGSLHGVTHSNWKKGGNYLRNMVDEDDKVITTLPLAALYYSGKSDYYLRQNEYFGILNNDSQLIDIYSGNRILNTYEVFLQVINDYKGWVIVDKRLDMYYTDELVRDYIRNNMTFHPNGSDDTIQVYSWNIG